MFLVTASHVAKEINIEGYIFINDPITRHPYRINIEENKSENKSLLDVLYENTKIFLDELITKINEVLKKFDEKKETEILIKQ